MTGQDYTYAKLEAFLEVLGELIDELLAAGVSEVALRRTLLARAVYQFITDPSDGIASLDHFRKALERELASSPVQVAG